MASSRIHATENTVKNVQRIADSNFDRLQAKRGLTAKNQSQMTKLLPMLQVGSKAGPDEAQALAKMEARVAALKELRATLYKATVSVSKLHVVDKEQQLKKLTSARKKVVAIAASKPPVGVSKALRACVNELTSLREGVFVGTATSKKTLAIIACSNAVEHVDGLIAKTQERIAAHKSETVAASGDPVFQDEVVKVIQRTAEDAHKLASLKDKSFVVSRVPVVAVAKTMLDANKLKAKGFKAEDIGGYPVVHNQLVIGINKVMIGLKKSDVDDQGKSTKPIGPEKWLGAAEQVLAMIRKQTKIKYQLVDTRPYGHAGGAWFWAMPERDLNAFASAFPGKAVQLRNWGFAF